MIFLSLADVQMLSHLEHGLNHFVISKPTSKPYMLDNVELEETFVLTKVASEIAQFEMNSIDVLFKIVFVSDE